ncbi:MAG: gamma-glutamylcyclotransferase family protein [Rubrobacteraceae bacterium]
MLFSSDVRSMQPPSQANVLVLFVYGTLKCGFDNHGGFCDGALQIEDATVYGDLYDLPFGFPALVVPEATVEAIGTTDPNLDVATQHRLSRSPPHHSQNRGPRAFGELLTFNDPGDRLPKLDHLEGFDPDGRSLYRRILVPVETANLTTLAWTYAIKEPTGTHLPDGRWPS